MSTALQILPVEGLPEILPGTDLAAAIAAEAVLADGDVLVVAQKVVSKAEGRLVDLTRVRPGARAEQTASRLQADPRLVQVILDESVRIVREDRVLITQTRHGYVCANAGVDHSNVPGLEMVSLLPQDCDESAERLRARLSELTRMGIAVIVADTFGRPWRMGLVNVALGVAGLAPLVDYRGLRDGCGQELRATVMAIADELAAAAELVMGKTLGIPAAIVRGYRWPGQPGRGRDLLRPAEEDLFR